MAVNTSKTPVPQIKRWRANQPVDHRRLNDIVDATNRLSGGTQPPRQVNKQLGRAPSGEAIWKKWDE